MCPLEGPQKDSYECPKPKGPEGLTKSKQLFTTSRLSVVQLVRLFVRHTSGF